MSQELLRCTNPSCGKSDIRYRSSDNTYGCRVCGHRWKKEQIEELQEIKS